MYLHKFNHPVLFYALSLLIPWILWFSAAYISHLTPEKLIYDILVTIFGIVGLAAPMIIAFILIWQDPILKTDLLSRFFNFSSIKWRYILLACGLMLASILLAQLVSLLFGYNISQFSFSNHFSFTAGALPAWFTLLVAPIFEELGWHTYGTDTLRRKMNVFSLSIVFAVFWAIWHFPLFFIQDYYQSNVAESGMIYSLNFAISTIPFVLLTNWIYYKANRNVILIIIIHLSSGFFNEIFATHPDSKIIQTFLLICLTIFVVYKNPDLFFNKTIAK